MGNLISKKSSNAEYNLNEREIVMIANNTSFDRDQILDWYDGFLDECPNGKMNKRNFNQFYMKLYPNGNSEKFCKYVFRLFDTDNNGYINFTEFILSVSITISQDLIKKLNLAFELYDIDKDGFIDKKEIVKILDAVNCLVSTEDSSSSFMKRNEEYRSYLTRLKLLADDVVKQLAIRGNSNLISRDEFIEGCLNDSNLKEILIPYI